LLFAPVFFDVSDWARTMPAAQTVTMATLATTTFMQGPPKRPEL